MAIDIMLERLARSGLKAEVVGEDHNAKLFVDGVEVGSINYGIVNLY